LKISAADSLDSALKKTQGLTFGGTDCALPMLWALKDGVEVDVFVVMTDNETWAGHTHPSQALQQYRRKTGIPAKLVVVGMTATECSIADQNDAGMLDIAGMDIATPNLIADFARD
jgi:60 kDa SS-A/Ro ribonucleoprotein